MSDGLIPNIARTCAATVLSNYDVGMHGTSQLRRGGEDDPALTGRTTRSVVACKEGRTFLTAPVWVLGWRDGIRYLTGETT